MKFLSLLGGLLGVGSVLGNPYIPESFQTGIIVNGVPWSSAPVQQITGFLAQDGTGQRSILAQNNSAFIIYDTKIYPEKLEAVWVQDYKYCHLSQLTQAFGPMFQWLNIASSGGQVALNGVPTDLWSLNLTEPSGTQSSLNLWAIGNTPVRLAVASSVDQATTIFDFFGFSAVNPPDSDFVIPSPCTNLDETEQTDDDNLVGDTNQDTQLLQNSHNLLRRLGNIKQ